MRSDNPVYTKEEDLIERYDFSKRLVSDLLNTFENGQDSLVIGINGKWGTGKSTVLNFIEAEIEKQTKNETTSNIVFRFNPWMFAGQADLQKSFLSQLGLRLKTENPQNKKLWEDIMLISYLLSFGNVFNPEPVTKGIFGGSLIGFRQILKLFSNKESIEKVYNRVELALKDSKIKVFIIIDDIDRLASSEIVEVMRLVRLNGNLKNTFYFLAYDINILKDAFNEEWKIDGEEY